MNRCDVWQRYMNGSGKWSEWVISTYTWLEPHAANHIVNLLRETNGGQRIEYAIRERQEAKGPERE